jgi:preprotein translocase subunit SecG
MEQILTVIHIFTAIALIGFILIQQGKGAEAGASCGAGASQTIFGSQGTGSILTRITAILATTFFITSLILGYMALHQKKQSSIEELVEKAQPVSSESQSSAPIKGAGQADHADHDIPNIPMTQIPGDTKTDKVE